MGKLSLDDIYTEYAAALGRGVDSLSDAEKKQAFLNAILAGHRVEPFATWCDTGDAVIAHYAPGAKTLNQLVREMLDDG